MDFEKIEAFLRLHWPAALMTAILVAPPTWYVARSHTDGETALYKATISELQRQNVALEELRKRIAERPEFSVSGLSVELYTPSQATP